MVKTKEEIFEEARRRYELTQCHAVGCCGDLNAALAYVFNELRRENEEIRELTARSEGD